MDFQMKDLAKIFSVHVLDRDGFNDIQGLYLDINPDENYDLRNRWISSGNINSTMGSNVKEESAKYKAMRTRTDYHDSMSIEEKCTFLMGEKDYYFCYFYITEENDDGTTSRIKVICRKHKKSRTTDFEKGGHMVIIESENVTRYIVQYNGSLFDPDFDIDDEEEASKKIVLVSKDCVIASGHRYFVSGDIIYKKDRDHYGYTTKSINDKSPVYSNHPMLPHDSLRCIRLKGNTLIEFITIYYVGIYYTIFIGNINDTDSIYGSDYVKGISYTINVADYINIDTNILRYENKKEVNILDKDCLQDAFEFLNIVKDTTILKAMKDKDKLRLIFKPDKFEQFLKAFRNCVKDCFMSLAMIESQKELSSTNSNKFIETTDLNITVPKVLTKLCCCELGKDSKSVLDLIYSKIESEDIKGLYCNRINIVKTKDLLDKYKSLVDFDIVMKRLFENEPSSMYISVYKLVELFYGNGSLQSENYRNRYFQKMVIQFYLAEKGIAVVVID